MKDLQEQTIRPGMMLEHNAQLVFQLLARGEPRSRAEIARTLGFSKSTVSGIVAVLLQRGVIRVAGRGNPGTGRSSELLAFDPAAVLYPAVNIGGDRVEYALVDLAGRIVARRTSTISARMTSRDVAVGIARECTALIRFAGEAHRRAVVGPLDNGRGENDHLHPAVGPEIPAIGIMVPGVVDHERGTVIYSSVVGWDEPVELAAIVRERCGIPVFLENNANALALAETWVGRGGAYDSIVYLLWEKGLGGAFVSRSHLLHGSSYAGMEAGKTLVAVPGETVPRTVESALKDLFDVESGPDCDRRERCTEVLVQLTTNLVALFNPAAIFLDTGVEASSHPRENPADPLQVDLPRRLRDRIPELLPARPRREVTVLPTSLSPEKRVLGGAASAIHRGSLRSLITGV